jgi:serine/threonine-protein kinase HipA
MNEEVAELFIENRKRISISGVQEKLSFVLEKNVLRLSKEGDSLEMSSTFESGRLVS